MNETRTQVASCLLGFHLTCSFCKSSMTNLYTLGCHCLCVTEMMKQFWRGTLWPEIAILLPLPFECRDSRWVPLCPDLINKASSWGPEPCVKVNKGELELPRGFLIVMKTQIRYSPPPFPWHWRGNMKRQKSQIVELKAGALNRIFKSYRKWIYPTLPRQVEKEKKMKKVWCIIMHWKFSQETCTSKSASQNFQILCACSISFTDTNTEDTFFILICGTCECVLHRL